MHGWSLPACLPSKCVFVLLPSKGPTGRQAGTQGSSAVVHTTAQYSTVLVSHPPKPSSAAAACYAAPNSYFPHFAHKQGRMARMPPPFVQACMPKEQRECICMHGSPYKSNIYTCVFHGCRIDEWLCPELFWRIYAYTNLF